MNGNERPGATGKFPQGKLCSQDRGELGVLVSHARGKVVIDFGKDVSWIAMAPEQAETIARGLDEHAAAARAQQEAARD